MFEFPFGNDLILKKEQRNELAQIINPITPENKLKKALKTRNKIISVGDMVTLTLFKNDIYPDVCFVDGKTKRHNIDKKDIDFIKSKINKYNSWVLINNPGEISNELWINTEQIMLDGGYNFITVKGEEDLAAIVCFSLFPIGTLVVYGIPNQGIEIVEINDKIKEFADNTLKNMEIKRID